MLTKDNTYRKEYISIFANMAECLEKIVVRLNEPIIDHNGKELYSIYVPCGKCPRCIERRKMEWSFRIENEMEYSKVAYFVTLTYSPEHLPINKYGRKTLVPTKYLPYKKGEKKVLSPGNREDVDLSLQGFWMRLRIIQQRTDVTMEHLFNNLTPKDKIKFFAAGEYGSERGRPHYHAIIFNASRTVIEKSWKLGSIDIIKANAATIAYLMKYLDKSFGAQRDKSKVAEFNIMSEEIGLNYVKEMREWHIMNFDVLYVMNKKGLMIPMPKYYRLKIFEQYIRDQQVLLIQEVMNEQNEELKNKYAGNVNNYYAMLKARINVEFKKKMKKRNID